MAAAEIECRCHVSKLIRRLYLARLDVFYSALHVSLLCARMRMASVTRLNYRVLQITEAGKGCSTRNRAKERALIMVLVMSAYEAT